MKNKHSRLKEDVLREKNLINETLTKLDKIISVRDADLQEDMKRPAIGTYLMNFYNGVENIIKRISREYYGRMPKGESWHQELLMQSCNPPEGKVPILTEEIVDRLHKYRGFRHIFVSGYGFKLSLERMTKLIDDVTPLWTDIKKAIDEFFDCS